MEIEITPEQKAQLTTWASQRDNILSEISALQDAKATLEKSVSDKADSFKDIEDRMNQVLGRIEELNKKEAELPALISTKILSLEKAKTILETEVTSLTKDVSNLKLRKEEIEKDILLAISIFGSIKDETSSLEKIVGHVTKVSSDNETIINGLVENLKKSIQDMIDVNEKNVKEAGIILDKLPRMMMELQKSKLIINKI